MRNLVRLVYEPRLNFLEHSTRESRKKLEEMDASDIINHLNLILEELVAEDEVVLNAFFSNCKRPDYTKWYLNLGYSLCVFPRFGEVDYRFKPGNFWVHMRDPYKVKDLHVPFIKGGPDHSAYYKGIRDFILFKHNPFENSDRYEWQMRFIHPNINKTILFTVEDG